MSGRPKGAKNKKSFSAEIIASNFNTDPFQVLMMIMSGDWKGLGFSGPTKTLLGKDGSTYEVDQISVADRLHAAKEATKYLYSTKQSVHVSSGEEGFKIIIEDYRNK